MKFPSITPSQKFSEIELSMLDFWKKNDVFQKSVDSRPADNEYVFFDGPPFATGTPHYGHILAGAIKDAIPRYMTMKGFRVNRKWGWDCHGVPVEFDVEKRFNIGGKPGIEKMGVANFNETCRSIVLEYTDAWEKTVERMGRFVDFKNDYKTMDPDFMESVWSVFKELWNKGLIYEGEKVIAYSPKLGSPLSNFEAGQNYKDIDDPAVTVKFPILSEGNLKGVNFLAWTTTPWTMPSNLMLCVRDDIVYAEVETETENFIVAKAMVEKIFGENAKIVREILGENLVGLSYEPPFAFFKDHANAFKVTSHQYIEETSGTGIGHMAPTGEVDAEILQREGVKLLYPFNESVYFDFNTVSEFLSPAENEETKKQRESLQGKYFRQDATVEGSLEDNGNVWVIEELKKSGKLFKREQIRHSYPHCWRTDCALMYRGIKTWFVNVQKIKNLMLEQNQEINWNPDHLKDGRFGKILENAPDWAISRNRYWGAPIPVWRCESCGHTEVISTREELLAKTGKEVNDLHKHFVDELSWECEKCSAKMQRIPEVLDCWFESGAMPYASRGIHFQRSIPNDQFSIKTPETEQEWEAYHSIAKNEVLEFYHPEIIYDKNHEDQLRPGALKKIFLHNGEIVGSAFLYPKTEKRVFMGLFGVKKSSQKMGFGTVFFAELERFLQEKGFEELVFNANEKVLPFYEKNNCIKNFWIPDIKPLSGTIPYGKKLEKKKETEIFFVRHGESLKNFPVEMESCSLESAKKYPLTEKGTADAEKEAQKYQNFFDVIVTSPFLRAKQTAEIFAKTSPNAVLLQDMRLKNTDVGEFDDKPLLESNQYQNEVMKNSPFEKFKGGESLQEVQKRMMEVFEEVKKQYPRQKVLLVSHGGPLGTLQDTILGKAISYYETEFVLKGKVTKIFPENFASTSAQKMQADFIAEGLDQTRGWFYTLHVLGCALTGKNIFKNVITNGIVLAEDGQKMSKSKKNYPDPSLIFDKYGADAMRYYMLSSPVVRAENFRFAEKGVEEVLKTILIPLQNVYSFFAMYANIDGFEPIQNSKFKIQNCKTDLDKWILGEYEKMRAEFTEKFERYKLDEALRPIPEFIDSLTNWYIRRSRDRFWESGMNEEKKSGYETLYFVLKNLAKILAPIMPFYAEFLWKNLTENSKSDVNSVHLQNLAESAEEFLDENLSAKTKLLRELITLSASIRARKKLKRRQPLKKMSFALSTEISFSQEDMNLLQEEANVKNLEILKSITGLAKQIIKADARQIGKKFGKKTQEIINAGKAGEFSILDNGQILVCGEILESTEYEMAFECAEGIEGEGTQSAVVLLDTEISEELFLEGIAREIIRTLQEGRKTAQFNISDRISVQWFSESENIKKAYEQFGNIVDTETLTTQRNFVEPLEGNIVEMEEEKFVFMLSLA